ncbi:Biopolymer transport protein ExbD [invertebrate metagenome]|uniref:Biopolymer transport protein ExbD n=1 Tax=invertebrate metagenome TaxID=1711999 RepID=A0A2H9TAQ9_9ZZZZ
MVCSRNTRSRGRRRQMAEINMVPFIDIMMVLLVAFMVSAPMLTQGVKVDLPKVSSQPMPVKESRETLVLSVNARGDYFIDLGSQRENARGLPDIEEKVSKVVAAQPDIKVLIKGDEAVNYGSVITLMAHLQGAGVKNVGLITEPVQDINR